MIHRMELALAASSVCLKDASIQTCRMATQAYPKTPANPAARGGGGDNQSIEGFPAVNQTIEKGTADAGTSRDERHHGRVSKNTGSQHTSACNLCKRDNLHTCAAGPQSEGALWVVQCAHRQAGRLPKTALCAAERHAKQLPGSVGVPRRAHLVSGQGRASPP